jgi:hypothetical protein
MAGVVETSTAVVGLAAPLLFGAPAERLQATNPAANIAIEKTGNAGCIDFLI